MGSRTVITPADLEPFRDSGVVAAAKALRRSTRKINAVARRHGFEFSTTTEVENSKRRKARNQAAADVRRLAKQMLSQREMCEQLGITRAILRRIAEENRIDINSRNYG